jgi:Peptidase family M28
MKNILIPLAVSTATLVFAQNERPEINQLTVTPEWANATITLQFGLTDAESDPLTVQVELSTDGGKTYSLPFSASGDVGNGQSVGSGKQIVVNYSPYIVTAADKVRVRLSVVDNAALDIQALVNEVDSNRLRNDLSFVEGRRHRTNSLPHLHAVRDSMLAVYRQGGLFTQTQNWNLGNYTASNVIGSSTGMQRPGQVLIVDAHYDSVSNSPGADDNGTGTVGVMEIARLLADYPVNNTLRFIGFDLEESGLLGSMRYVNNGGLPATDTVQGVFNLEMIGYYTEEPNTQEVPTGFCTLFSDACMQLAAQEYRGNFITNVANNSSNALMQAYAASAAAYVPELRVINLLIPQGAELFVPDLLRSDHASFWNAGDPALMLTDGSEFRNECYHTPSDTFDNKLSMTFMSRVVQATLGAMVNLGGVQHGHWLVADLANPVSTRQPLLTDFSGRYLDGVLEVSLPATDWPATHLTVYNAAGMAVWSLHLSELGQGLYHFPLPELPSGIYTLSVVQEKGKGVVKLKI